MEAIISRFSNSINLFHSSAFIILKTSVGVGIFCLILYLFSISYIPSEVSFGDTLIFLLIFFACAVAYLFLSLILFLCGISLSPLAYLALITIDNYLSPHDSIKNKAPVPKINILTLLATLYLLYVIRNIFFIHWSINAYFAFTVCLISMFYYLFYLNHLQIKTFPNKFKNLEEIINDPESSDNIKSFAKTKLKRFDIYKQDRLQVAFFLALIPLVPMFLFQEVGTAFLNYTMQKSGVRVEKATLYIKEPYVQLIELPNTTTPQLKEYKISIIKDAKILFQGIGKNTLISYQTKNTEKQIVIPNEYITIEKSGKVKP